MSQGPTNQQVNALTAILKDGLSAHSQKGSARFGKTSKDKRLIEALRNANMRERNYHLRTNRRSEQAPVAVSHKMIARQPSVNSNYKSCVIKHRELLANINGSQNFSQAVNISVNPGLKSAFPWLSTQAQNWEMYKFRKLEYKYITRCPTNVPGSVLMVPDYDPADSPPQSEQTATTYIDSVENVCWEQITCRLDPSKMKPLGPKHFIRSGPLAPNLDIKTYDSANFYLFTNDGGVSPAGQGKLWVDYEVELSNPQLPPSGGVQYGFDHLYNSATQAAFPFGQSNLAIPVRTSGSTPLVSFSTSIPNRMTFLQKGRYLVTIINTGNGGLVSNFGLNTPTNCTLGAAGNVFSSNTGNNQQNTFSTSSANTQTTTTFVDVLEDGGTVLASQSGTVTSGWTDIMVTSVSGSAN